MAQYFEIEVPVQFTIVLSYWDGKVTKPGASKRNTETMMCTTKEAYSNIELMANLLIRRHAGRLMTGSLSDTFWLQSCGARHPSPTCRHGKIRQRPLALRER
jgi:hypothetical protein